MEKIRRSILMGGGKALLLGFALLVIALAATGCEQPDNNVADYITTADGTWEIYTADGLLAWNAYVMKNTGTPDTPEYPNLGTSAKLMADISLEGKSWTPVGYYFSPLKQYSYAGTFDGGGHTISNLKIESSDSKSLGLFGGIAPDGVVKDLILKDVYIYVNVDMYYAVGGIAGYNEGTIENCSVSGSVSGNRCVGGIAGVNEGIITACYNTGDVYSESGDYIGGIAGGNDGTITACYNTGDVYSESGDYIGGIAGGNNGTIIACYNTGDVSGSLNIGGIVGQNYSENITACYWSGETPKGIGNDESAPGVIYVDSAWDISIINRLNNEIYLYNQENTDNICNFHYVEGNDFTKLESGAPKLIPGKIENASFASTELTLKIGGSEKLELILEPEGVAYSIITWKSSNEKVATVDKQGLVCAHKTGTTTITATIDTVFSAECTIKVPVPNKDIDGYEITTDGTWNIYTADGLLEWNAYVTTNGDYSNPERLKTNAVLMDNITLLDNWTPVGTNTNRYTGTFDGNRYTISNLKIDSSDSYYLGLFAYIATDGVVKDLTLSNVAISGNSYIGGIAGYNYGTIENCSVSGSVSGTYAVGGIVGNNHEIIENCSLVEGSISGDRSVGGIAGYNWSTISDCSASGSIIGMYRNTGGIAGGNEGEIIACHNAGDVSLEQSGGVMVYVGGIVGQNSNCVIACYNTGNVSFSSYSGGIVGDNYGEIIACYSIGDISGDYSSGGITGSIDSGTLKSNYWAKGTEGTPEFGIGNKKSNDNATEVDGSEGKTWADATNAMNNAITVWNGDNNNGCGYHFVLKDGESSEPPVLEKGAPETI